MNQGNITQEHRGLAKVHSVCAEMEAVWRPTPCADLGIDGQIEFLELGATISTGHIIAVQVKSGSSYFRSEDNLHVKYYPSEKHRRYWKRLNLPVILVLHDPDRDLTIYSRVKPQLRKEGPIVLRKDSYFRPSARLDLLALAREDAGLTQAAQVLEGFKAATLNLTEGRKISGIEFLLACTNLEQGYFELRMCRIIALLEFAAGGRARHIFITRDTYEFIQRCALRCIAAALTEPFEQDFADVWYGLEMVPDIAVPLTPIGLEVVGHLWSNLEEYLSIDTFSDLACLDIRALAKTISDAAQAESDQQDAYDRLGKEPR